MRTIKTLVVLVLSVFLLSVILYFWLYSDYTRSGQVKIDENKLYPVVYVIDGDTFKVKIENKTITIRLLVVNTPETVDPRKTKECYGEEASKESKSLLFGRKVQLKLNPNREARDKYGRYLAYVYRDDGLFINDHLILHGYAREYTYGSPYSMRSKFIEDENLAKNNKVGLWMICDFTE